MRLSGHDKKVSEHDRLITERTHKDKEQDKHLSEHDKKVSEHDRLIAERKHNDEEQDAELVAHSELLSVQSAQIRELISKNISQDELINKLIKENKETAEMLNAVSDSKANKKLLVLSIVIAVLALILSIIHFFI